MGTEIEGFTYTYSQVSAHNTCEDCWVIINGKVYNVTSYLNEHPGGDEVLLEQAGKDASTEFEEVGHGSAARLMLDEFYIGEVFDLSTKCTQDDVNPYTPPDDIEDRSLDKTNKFIYFLMVLAIVGLGVGIHLLLHQSVN